MGLKRFPCRTPSYIIRCNESGGGGGGGGSGIVFIGPLMAPRTEQIEELGASMYFHVVSFADVCTNDR